MDGNVTEQTGTLKWYNKVDNYGFIFVPALGADALLHKSCITDDDVAQLKKNAEVRFNCIAANGKFSVKNIISIAQVELPWRDASIKWFNERTGFGFALYTDEDGNIADVFVHASTASKVKCELAPGKEVQLVIVKDNGGRLRADNIRLAPSGATAK